MKTTTKPVETQIPIKGGKTDIITNEFETFADTESMMEWLMANPQAHQKVLATLEDYTIYHPFNSLLRRNAEMALDDKKKDKVVDVPMSLTAWLLKPVGQRSFGPTKEDVKKATGWLDSFAKDHDKMPFGDRMVKFGKIANHLRQIAQDNLPGWEAPAIPEDAFDKDTGEVENGIEVEWFHNFAMLERVERKNRDKAKAEAEAKRLAELMSA